MVSRWGRVLVLAALAPAVLGSPAGASPRSRGAQTESSAKAVVAPHTPLRGPAGGRDAPTAPQAAVQVPPSSAYVLADVGTGAVIAAYRERRRLPPASLTKILTALVAVGYLPAGARVPGTRQSINAYPNDVGIEKGVGWPLEDVLQALLVFSANDAAYALAQKMSGSLSAFGALMDRAALQMGMSDRPVFHDPAGLDGPEGVGGGNLVSARDLAIAGRDLLAVPRLAAIVREHSYRFVDPTGKPHDLPSMNYVFLESYVGAVGVKTGFTDRAGACIVAAATRHGRTMLAVVMNSYNTTQSAIELLNLGFATPVKAETGDDRLPPVALPAPPPAHPRPGERANDGPQAGYGQAGRNQAGASNSLAARGPGAAPSQRGGPRGADAPRGVLTAAGPHGLASVLSSWFARFLLVAAGLAAVTALWELAGANRSARRRPATSPAGEASPFGATFRGGRKRRRQLVDSYRRHERGASFARPPGPRRP